MVRINGLFHLLINGVYWGYNPFTNLVLTSSNFLGHPSRARTPRKLTAVEPEKEPHLQTTFFLGSMSVFRGV